jgi:hypothetical protein
MWWTVKHWKITGSYYYYRTLPPEGYEEISGSIDVTTDDLIFASTDFVNRILANGGNEKKLVCERGRFGGQRNFQWTIELDRVADDGNGPVESTTTSPLNLDFGGARFQTGTAPQFAKSEITPENINNPAELWVNMAIGFASWSTESSQKDRQAVCAFNLLNISKEIVLYSGESDATETLELTLEPLEFWEYDPGDGKGPIYDKTTGETLR